MQDEKRMQDDDYNQRHDQYQMQIDLLREEIQELNQKLNERNRAINTMQNELVMIRDRLGRMDQEIVLIKKEKDEKNNLIAGLRKDIEGLAYQASKVREDKAKDHGEIDRLRIQIAENDKESKENAEKIESGDAALNMAMTESEELQHRVDTEGLRVRGLTQNLDQNECELLLAKDEHTRLVLHN